MSKELQMRKVLWSIPILVIFAPTAKADNILYSVTITTTNSWSVAAETISCSCMPDGTWMKDPYAGPHMDTET